MFDFDAGKLIIVGIAALIFIPPKDLPRVLRQLGQAVGKMRRMASEFQGQFMEAVREADMADIKADVAKLADSAKLDASFNPLADIKNEIKGAIDKPAVAGPPRDGALADAPLKLAEATSTEPFAEGAKSEPDLRGETIMGGVTQEGGDAGAQRDIEAEMQALASALKAEIKAAAPHVAAQAPDALRHGPPLQDNA